MTWSELTWANQIRTRPTTQELEWFELKVILHKALCPSVLKETTSKNKSENLPSGKEMKDTSSVSTQLIEATVFLSAPNPYQNLLLRADHTVNTWKHCDGHSLSFYGPYLNWTERGESTTKENCTEDSDRCQPNLD